MKWCLGVGMVIIGIMAVSVSAESETTSWFQDEATSGAFAEAGNGSYTLTLNGIDDSVVHYSDYQYPSADVIPIDAQTFSRMAASGPINAAVKLADSDSEDQDTLMATISNPEYDAKKGTLSFTAVPIDDPTNVSGNLGPYAKDADPSIPTTFGKASIFYDGGVQQNGQDEGVNNFNCAQHDVDCFDSSDGEYYGSAQAECFWGAMFCVPIKNADYAACKGKYGDSHGYRVEQRTLCHY